MPHRAVSDGRRGDTKWRIVFDASSHEKGAPSLNDALEMGPKLLLELFATLLRFRLTPVAITGDIRQVFLQLHLDEKDRDLTRFFWYRVARDYGGDYATTCGDLLSIYPNTFRPNLQSLSTFGTGTCRDTQGYLSHGGNACRSQHIHRHLRSRCGMRQRRYRPLLPT